VDAVNRLAVPSSLSEEEGSLEWQVGIRGFGVLGGCDPHQSKACIEQLPKLGGLLAGQLPDVDRGELVGEKQGHGAALKHTLQIKKVQTLLLGLASQKLVARVTCVQTAPHWARL
jgi:hypothetical protein